MSHRKNLNRFALTAFSFETALGAVAIGLGLLIQFDPLSTILLATEAAAAHVLAMLQGVLAALPLVVALLVMKRLPQTPFVRLRTLVAERLVPMFAPLSTFELIAISIAAGFGEETLFRGLVQAGIAEGIGGPNGLIIALVVTSLVFGACHWLTHTYAILATIGSLYFGVIFVWSDNLLTPIVAHGLYDFIALAYLTTSAKLDLPEAP